jgi:predicted TIM-barrel fold metal-dependent hydrolase
MWNHAEELKRFLNLGLTEAEEELILYKNTERLLGL